MTPHPTTACARVRTHRRGSAYVAVFGISLLVTTVGMGAMLSLRSQRRAADLRNDEADARAAAGAAVDVGAQALSLGSSWRSTYSNGVYTTPRGLGRAGVAFKLVDEGDGSLSDDALESVRLYGAGRVDGAARIASVVLAPTGPALAVLQAAAYSAVRLSVSGTVYSSDGPLACAGPFNVALLAMLNGDVECGTLVNLGTIAGTVTTGVAARAMPSGTLFATYSAMGTAIPFSGILSATMQKKVLGAGVNPYGAPDAGGVYTIDVPALSTLTITQCRINATLVVSLGVGSTLTIAGANAWDPPGADMPALLVGGVGLATVNIGGSTGPLSESAQATNFNPATAPYFGNTNTTTTDSYPSEVRGLIHIMGSAASTSISSNAMIRGACIAEGPISISGDAVLAAEPGLFASPPRGYFTPTGMVVQGATWRREADN